MKFGGSIFSICAFLLISLPLFDALIKCPLANTGLIDKDKKGEKTCEDVSCAVYSCSGTGANGTFNVNGTGCVKDFFRDCAEFQTAVEFILSSPYEMTYFNGNVTYVSGCAKAKDVKRCLTKKSNNFQKEITEKQNNGTFEDGKIITDYSGVPVEKNTALPNVLTDGTKPPRPKQTTDASSVFLSTSGSDLITPSNGSSDAPTTSVEPVSISTLNPDVVTPSNGSTDAPTSETTNASLVSLPTSKQPFVPDPVEPVSITPSDGSTVAPALESTTTTVARSSRTAATTSVEPLPQTSTNDVKEPTAIPDPVQTTTPNELSNEKGTTGVPDSKTSPEVPDSKTSPEVPDSDETTTASKDNNASKGQDGSYWKKLGCFLLGLILAAWIY